MKNKIRFSVAVLLFMVVCLTSTAMAPAKQLDTNTEAEMLADLEKARKTSNGDQRRQTVHEAAWRLIVLYRETDRSDKEERIYRQMMALARADGDTTNEGLYAFNLGQLYQQQERHADAVPCFERELTLKRAEFPNGNINLVRPLSELSCELIQVKEYKRAEPLVKEGLAIAESHGTTSEVGRFAEYYAQLCLATGRLIEAAQYTLQARIQGRKGVTIHVVESSRDIPAGSAIRSEWLREASYFLAEDYQGCPPYGAIRAKDFAVGHKAKYTLRAGTCITTEYLE